ncbi:hypothetical protein CY35_12G018700 [Sphagnum magellanicum]|nr:hypothetical protein CY35_12G018700 [Sphagnum magellanicum]KAH9544874.1 hypothetical protein CY35_12G018700 [Sphagnum magellanicum]
MRILSCKLHLVLLLLLSTSQCIFSDEYCSHVQTFFYQQGLEALQAILQAWNQTPDMSTNLAGWNSSQPLPCFQPTGNWKGVLCFTVQDRSDGNCSAHISGLSLTDASIVGTLPEQIGNLSYLFDLTLANNPGLSGPLPSWLLELGNLVILDLHNCSFNGSIADELFDVPYLLEVDLSANQFTGHLPNYGGADHLLTLNISHNKLSWPSPSNYNSSTGYGLLNATSLTVLDLSNNNFIGSLPDLNLFPVNLQELLQNNPYCSHQQSSVIGRNCYCNQNCVIPNNDVQQNVRRAIIIATTISGTILVLVIAISSWLLWRNKQNHRVLLHQAQEKFAEFDVQPTIFSYSKLRAATKDFHPDMKLGQGSYGVVYKGIFPNKNEVVVKQLFNESQQSIDEFLNEIVLITRVKHRNLVKLKGCCITTSKKRLLVYEYVENNDLEQALFVGKGKHMLNWPVRFNICLRVARGLFYLHEIAQPRIIHRDIKASNILLDKDLQARIADFGLALLFPEDQTHITTMHIASTKGYLTPEYATRGQLTEKVDVYSFGVLVLEIMSGRKNIDPNLPPQNIYLLDIAWRLARKTKNSIMNLVDCTLELHNDEMKEALQVVKIALLCLQQNPDNRPTMARVVAMLQGEAEIMEIILDDNSKIESMNKVYENTLLSSKITFSSISQCFEESNVPMLKGSSSSNQIYDFASKRQPFEVESFNG